ncbi:COP1-interacting protein 4.1 [Quillaja saponaria]|uniref:COP1-interacting protein 4.1 n=1 Tax=Quillaja saponaria TaxID=32244 RepID=A0AAD7M429_QUISA|nr:COP1-interacting protein 4.1 [Quillaja saponaria]
MAALASEVSVFADTNLDTRIAMTVPPDITAGEFKNVERVHFSCFPKSGQIQVNGLMVKRKSCFYYLPDSVPLKYVFKGIRKTWFLHVEVRPKVDFCMPSLTHGVATEVGKHIYNCSYVPTSLESQKLPRSNEHNARGNSLEVLQSTLFSSNEMENKKRGSYSDNKDSGTEKASCCKLEESPAATASEYQCFVPDNRVENTEGNSMLGDSNDMSSEVISVTGIINRYFPNFNEIGSPSSSDGTSRVVWSVTEQSKYGHRSLSRIQTDASPQFTPKTPPPVMPSPLPTDSIPKIVGDKYKRSKVGKNLVVASRNLGVFANDQSPTASFCRFKNGKLFEPKSYHKNGLLYEISDSDG